MITRKSAIGITLIVLIGLTSWGLTGALEEQKYIDLGKPSITGAITTLLYIFSIRR